MPDPVAAVACLDEPTRRRLYDVVARSAAPMSRDEAAEAADVSRSTAAFHLDRLARAGLLEVTFARRSGRSGPGAGRPAKLYRRARGEVAVSLPGRRYPLAAGLLAAAFDQVEQTGERPRAALARLAQREGTSVGRSGGDLTTVLESCGYEPREAGDDEPPGIILTNCPFDELVGAHADLVCTMNLHLLEGLLGGLGASGCAARLDPGPDRCCVRLERAPAPSPRRRG